MGTVKKLTVERITGFFRSLRDSTTKTSTPIGKTSASNTVSAIQTKPDEVKTPGPPSIKEILEDAKFEIFRSMQTKLKAWGEQTGKDFKAEVDCECVPIVFRKTKSNEDKYNTFGTFLTIYDANDRSGPMGQPKSGYKVKLVPTFRTDSKENVLPIFELSVIKYSNESKRTDGILSGPKFERLKDEPLLDSEILVADEKGKLKIDSDRILEALKKELQPLYNKPAPKVAAPS